MLYGAVPTGEKCRPKPVGVVSTRIGPEGQREREESACSRSRSRVPRQVRKERARRRTRIQSRKTGGKERRFARTCTIERTRTRTQTSSSWQTCLDCFYMLGYLNPNFLLENIDST